MAYYNPFMYNPNYNPNYNPGYVQQGLPQPMQQAGGFVPIPSEEDARNFPVQRGTSTTFRDENKPYIYIKTLGMGQLDSPIFEKYRILKENDQSTQRADSGLLEDKQDKTSNFVTKAEYEALCEDIEDLKGKFDKLRRELGT